MPRSTKYPFIREIKFGFDLQLFNEDVLLGPEQQGVPGLPGKIVAIKWYGSRPYIFRGKLIHVPFKTWGVKEEDGNGDVTWAFEKCREGALTGRFRFYLDCKWGGCLIPTTSRPYIDGEWGIPPGPVTIKADCLVMIDMETEIIEVIEIEVL